MLSLQLATPCRSCVDKFSSRTVLLSPQRTDANYYSGNTAAFSHEYRAQGL